jgi:uncharacterized membrane protein
MSATGPRNGYWWLAMASWTGLLALCVAWELWLDPSPPLWLWTPLKLFPLLAALPGLWRGKLYTMQWASMVVMLYMAEGCVRGTGSHELSRWLAWTEFALAWAAFAGLVLYLRPFKRAAKARVKREAAGGR